LALEGEEQREEDLTPGAEPPRDAESQRRGGGEKRVLTPAPKASLELTEDTEKRG
jgi:hypothetical protein